ncbi:MAG: hypothetical protein AB1758_03400 [Candidatus Eremiobacterota bacterium]
MEPDWAVAQVLAHLGPPTRTRPGSMGYPDACFSLLQGAVPHSSAWELDPRLREVKVYMARGTRLTRDGATLLSVGDHEGRARQLLGVDLACRFPWGMCWATVVQGQVESVAFIRVTTTPC